MAERWFGRRFRCKNGGQKVMRRKTLGVAIWRCAAVAGLWASQQWVMASLPTSEGRVLAPAAQTTSVTVNFVTVSQSAKAPQKPQEPLQELSQKPSPVTPNTPVPEATPEPQPVVAEAAPPQKVAPETLQKSAPVIEKTLPKPVAAKVPKPVAEAKVKKEQPKVAEVKTPAKLEPVAQQPSKPLAQPSKPLAQPLPKLASKQEVAEAQVAANDASQAAPAQPTTATVAKVETEASTAATATPAQSKPVWVSKPTFARQPKAPRYPKLARKRGQEGTVWLDVWLDEQGQQARLEVAQSSGLDMLDQSALKAVSKWRFKPLKQNGVAMASRVRIPVEFSLR